MDVLETMAAAKENATKIVQDFQKELILSVTKHEKRCSNCLKTSLTETWRICRGNYFCSECRNKGFTCAKLKIHQGDRCADTYRYPDDALVTLMNQLPRLCGHHNNGCKEIQEKEKMGEHEKDCVFRPIKCPHGCYNKVAFIQLMDHVKPHRFEVKELTDSKKFKLTQDLNGYGAITQIVAFGKTFFEVGRIQGNLMYRWIYLLGSPDEAKNFFCHITCKNIAKGAKIIYFDQVRSVDEDYETIIDNGDAFIIKRTFNDKEKSEISYELRNMKEEAKDENYESGIDD